MSIPRLAIHRPVTMFMLSAVVVLRQAARDELADGAVVLDDQDLHRSATGRMTVKVEPRPIAESTSMRPPWSAMIV